MNESECAWGKFYDSEDYLLGEVGPAFRETGNLDSADFYTILIWKAERAKNRHKKRLMEIAKGSFQDAVADIAKQLWEAPDGRHRLEILMNRWWFLLPTASAILTILYPEEFTVFDWRVCDELKYNYQPWCSRGFSDALWDQYEGFKRAVIEHTPPDISLRCKDRFLIGRSTRKSIEEDCRA
jgi:hypothetical protein